MLSILWIVCGLLLIQTTVSQVAEENPVIDDDSIYLQDDTPDASDFMALIHAPTPEVSYIHQVSRSFLRVTKDILSFAPRSPNGQVDIPNSLMNLRQLNPVDFTDLLREQGIVVPPSSTVTCDPSAAAYRRMDGSCNNLQRPCWGKAEEPYQRWLPPDYGNGIDEPRRRTDSLPLPSPRLIYQWVSSEFEPSPETQTSSLTTLLVTFGQFTTHEIIFTPTAKVASKIWDGQKFVDKELKCCNTSSVHPDCLPMFMSVGDIYYPPGHCMEFIRSTAYAHRPSGCYPPALGQRREQMNQLTAFIDASIVYGASETEMRNLRENNGRGAKLLMSNVHGVQYPPRKLNSICKSSSRVCDKRCHMVGEKRANENPALAALHTMFARHHNRLVDFLRIKGWDEETLFQVVRKIVGAQLQHIVYHEYLPAIIGRRLSTSLNLLVPTPQYQYDPSLNPSIYNVFVAAAFRYGHSMVNGKQKRRGRGLMGSPVLSHDFFSMDDFCETTSDPVGRLLGGQAEQKAQKVDCVFTKELTNHLFAKTPDGPGLDLFSINMQRGRDHGIPSYNMWRETCGLKKATSFNDLRVEIPDYIVDRLQAIYGADRVDDVDLFVAGVSEKPVNDGILGPTFTCIVANQFRNLKFGDRFWYENLNHPGAFTQAQIAEIRKTTLASLICANSDLEEIQLSAFLVEGLENQKFRCEDIVHTQNMNLNVWG